MLRQPNNILWDERLSEDDRRTIEEINSSLRRLNALRAVEINVSEHFARSKIAWKLAMYQHALLHRIVALMDGVAVAWNNRCTLSSILSARALMETIAVMIAFEDCVATFLDREDLAALDALAQQGIFASRDPEWCDQYPESQAVNVLTYIDKFDKKCTGFRRHYDALSERCHPNSLGHNFMFSRLDRSSGTVRYHDESDRTGNCKMLLAALLPSLLIESTMDRLDKLVLKVSDLQPRVSPVGG